MEQNQKKGFNLELRDVVIILSLVGSVIFQYFGMYQGHDSRLVKLETQRESLEKLLDKIETKVDILLNRHIGKDK